MAEIYFDNDNSLERIVSTIESIDADVQQRITDSLENTPIELRPQLLNRSGIRSLRGSMVNQASASINHLWDPRSRVVGDSLDHLSQAAKDSGIEVDKKAKDEALRRGYLMAERMTINGVNRRQRLEANRITQPVADKRLRDLLEETVKYDPVTGRIMDIERVGGRTQSFRLEAQDRRIEDLRNQIGWLEQEYKKTGSQQMEAALRRLRAEFDRRSKGWIRQVLNVSSIKGIAFAEAVRQMQFAQFAYIKEGMGARLARWTLSDYHNRGDVCDVCANVEWVTGGEKKQVLDALAQDRAKQEGTNINEAGFRNVILPQMRRDINREIEDWRGIIILPEVVRFEASGGLLIPALSKWSEGQVANAIYAYNRNSKKPDPRKKRAGHYPPHPQCKCRLVPVLV